MTDHQLKPFEQVNVGEGKDRLQIFEEEVLQHQGRVSSEDSNTAPLPESYPYRLRMNRRVYEKEKATLQIELLKVQSWVKESGQRIVSLFEGRDAAGKGGTIKRFMEHLTRAARAWWRWKNRPKPNAANGISSVTSKTCPLRAKWCSSTARGTTARAWNA